MRALGIPELRYWSRTPYGGNGAHTTVQHAAMAVATGVAKAVVVYRAFNERSGRRFGQPNAQTTPQGWNWYMPFGLDTPAKIYSLTFQRYMTQYGLTNEDFGRYTVVARKHAATNPNAWFYERPVTLDDHQNSRWIVEPILRLLDCCQESDGGVALVVTSADRAADLPHPAARIAAVAEADLGGGHVMFNYYHPDLSRFDETEFLARQLYTESGLGPTDMQAAMIYENFSPVVFLQLEALGFCGPGEARDFIAEGNIELGGKLPVNTHGGLLGEAYIHGVNNILEAVRQIRGTAVNQVPDVEHVMVAGGRSGIILGQAS
jgi:acetyl-CoA acetyltransferase